MPNILVMQTLLRCGLRTMQQLRGEFWKGILEGNSHISSSGHIPGIGLEEEKQSWPKGFWSASQEAESSTKAEQGLWS